MTRLFKKQEPTTYFFPFFFFFFSLFLTMLWVLKSEGALLGSVLDLCGISQARTKGRLGPLALPQASPP